MGAQFTETSLKFLRGLKRRNDREWFNDRKAIYEAEVKEPMLTLITNVNEVMLRFAPDHVRSPAKTMMRIYRDIRFSPDKRPYKSHAGAWWAKTGLEKTSGAGFYMHVAGNAVEVAAGVFMPEREQLAAIRGHLVLHHERVRGALHARALRVAGFKPIGGNPLSRPPKGFSEPLGAMDLLRCREWGVAASFPAEMALRPDFARVLARHFERTAPLVALLNEPLRARTKTSALTGMPL